METAAESGADVDGPASRLAWGDRARPPIPPAARRWLRARTGLDRLDRLDRLDDPPAVPRGDTPPRVAEGDLTIDDLTAGDPPAGGLPDGAHAALATAVGDRHVRTDPAARLGHAGGMSYLDLLRRRRGEPVALPDAVVCPADHDEVVAVLSACARHDVAVVPFGGGTSVVAGVAALRGGHAAVVALDLARLDRLLSVDTESLTATLQAGVRGPAVERLLGGHGLTLGHFPQSFERATVGGFAATRSAGQASAGFGRFDEMVLGLTLAAPTGELRLGRAPMSAAGPDLRHLVLGSEGAFGVITEVTVRVRRIPERRRYESWSLPSFDAGTTAVRRLAQDGVLPDVTRLADAEETGTTLALSGSRARTAAARGYLRLRGQRGPCLLVVGWEGSAAAVRSRRAAAVRTLRAAGAVYLGQGPGVAWLRGRFDAPYLRDTLLDAGLLVETLETAGPWSALRGLRAAVDTAITAALRTDAHRPLVLCHLSHAYPAGGSLYFTVVAPADPADPVGQWRRAKRAAGDAIMAGGGTITHHHAVGLDHLPWLEPEIGAVGVDVLRAVKRQLDPQGILNPGKLVPPAGWSPDAGWHELA